MLSDLLEPGSLLRSAWGRYPAVLRFDTTDPLVCSIVDQIDGMLAAGGMHADFVRMSNAKTEIPSSSWANDHTAGGRSFSAADLGLLAAAAIQHRATMSIVGLERITTSGRELKQIVEATLDARADLNLYATPACSTGFPAHYDPQDVVLLQLAGEKHWTLYEPEFKLPTPAHYFERTDVGTLGPSAEHRLSPGDALYMPRGWVHEGRTGSVGSLHLTLGLSVPSVAQRISSISHELSYSVETLRRAPNDVTPEELARVLTLVVDAIPKQRQQAQSIRGVVACFLDADV